MGFLLGKVLVETAKRLGGLESPIRLRFPNPRRCPAVSEGIQLLLRCDNFGLQSLHCCERIALVEPGDKQFRRSRSIVEDNSAKLCTADFNISFDVFSRIASRSDFLLNSRQFVRQSAKPLGDGRIDAQGIDISVEIRRIETNFAERLLGFAAGIADELFGLDLVDVRLRSLLAAGMQLVDRIGLRQDNVGSRYVQSRSHLVAEISESWDSINWRCPASNSGNGFQSVAKSARNRGISRIGFNWLSNSDRRCEQRPSASNAL